MKTNITSIAVFALLFSSEISAIGLRKLTCKNEDLAYDYISGTWLLEKSKADIPEPSKIMVPEEIKQDVNQQDDDENGVNQQKHYEEIKEDRKVNVGNTTGNNQDKSDGKQTKNYDNNMNIVEDQLERSKKTHEKLAAKHKHVVVPSYNPRNQIAQIDMYPEPEYQFFEKNNKEFESQQSKEEKEKALENEREQARLLHIKRDTNWGKDAFKGTLSSLARDTPNVDDKAPTENSNDGASYQFKSSTDYLNVIEKVSNTAPDKKQEDENDLRINGSASVDYIQLKLADYMDKIEGPEDLQLLQTNMRDNDFADSDKLPKSVQDEITKQRSMMPSSLETAIVADEIEADESVNSDLIFKLSNQSRTFE